MNKAERLAIDNMKVHLHHFSEEFILELVYALNDELKKRKK